jgi:glucosamine--fructose-6-phosphate aminotransferase (isomerizing)
MTDDGTRSAAFDPGATLGRAPDPWAFLPMPAVRTGPPWAMTEMIAAEPGLARRIVGRLVADGSAAALAETLEQAGLTLDPVAVTGCGTSEHAAMGVARILVDAWRSADLGDAVGEPRSVQAFELALDPPAEGLVIGISHEGGTGATIAALEAAREAGGSTALITASAGSPAAAAADLVLETLELDTSWCHTVGYVSPLVAACAVAAILTGRDPGAVGEAAADRLAGGIAAAERAADRIAAALAGATGLTVLGSGADIPAARELALKVEEGTWLPATARDLETFLHGHLAATDATTGLVLILADPAGREARVRRAIDALRAASVVGIRAAAILAADASAAIPAALTPAGRIVLPEAGAASASGATSVALSGPEAALLSTATALQVVTERLARARGTNPDPIRRDDPRYLAAADAAEG